MKRTLFLLLLLALILPTTAFADTNYDESTDGDLANDGANPSELVFNAGANRVTAASVLANDPSGDRDYFTFMVPDGMVLTAIILENYNSPGDALAFIAIEAGMTFDEPPAGTTVGNLLGYTHLGPGAGHTDGTDVLPDIAGGAGAQGFAPPLGAGSYSVWYQQTGSDEIEVTLAFMLSPVNTTVTHAEVVDGDLSGDGNAPTTVPLNVGGNIVSGSSANFDADYFSVTVPTDHVLDAMLLFDYVSQDGVAFGALQEGAAFTAGNDTSQMLGYAHFGPGDDDSIGSDLLDDFALGAGAIGFSQPLSSGTYTFWVQQAGPNTDYALNLVVTQDIELAVSLSNSNASTNAHADILVAVLLTLTLGTVLIMAAENKETEA